MFDRGRSEFGPVFALTTLVDVVVVVEVAVRFEVLGEGEAGSAGGRDEFDGAELPVPAGAVVVVVVFAGVAAAGMAVCVAVTPAATPTPAVNKTVSSCPPAVCATAEAVERAWAGTAPTPGRAASRVAGPAINRNRPMPTERNARTTSGSNCVPAQRVISARAASAVRGFL